MMKIRVLPAAVLAVVLVLLLSIPCMASSQRLTSGALLTITNSHGNTIVACHGRRIGAAAGEVVAIQKVHQT